MWNKRKYRLRRAKKLRNMLYLNNKLRLVIHKTSRHIYVQVISADNKYIISSASTVEKSIKKQLNYNTGNIKASELIGKIISLRVLKKGITNITFDRSGYKYHGRVSALANVLRKYHLLF